MTDTQQEISPTQHCTYNGDGDYTFSHTAQYCGREQPRRCGCPFCYPEEAETAMSDVPVSELLASDVGSRILISRGDSVFDGVLADLWVSRSDYDHKSSPKITARITVKIFGDTVAGGDKVLSDTTLQGIPLDFRVQIER